MISRRICASFKWSLVPLVLFGALAGKFSPTASCQAPDSPDKTWRLRGRITDDRGQPVGSIRVFTNELPYLNSAKQASATSNDRGIFVLNIAHRLNGRAIRASDSTGKLQGYVQLPYDAETVEHLGPLKLTIRAAREISANVADAAGDPVEGASVLVTSSYEQFAQVETDSDGRATVLQPADLPLQNVIALKPVVGLDYWAFRAKDAPKSDPYTLPNDHSEPLQFVLNGVRNITVRVVDEKDEPIAGTRVYPWLLKKPNKGGERDDLNLSGLAAFTRETDDQGVARFDVIPSDNTRSITFWAQAEGYHSPDRHTIDPASEESEVLARLIPLVKVSGRVLSAEGEPVADIEVLAAGAGYGSDDYRGSARTDAAGTFALEVYPDQFYQFAAGNRQWASQPIHRVVRAGKPVEGLELVLQPAVRIHGQVTVGPDCTPSRGVYVQLYPEDTTRGRFYLDLPEDQRLPNPKDSRRAILPQIVRNAVTNDAGEFEFFASPGKYYLLGLRNIEPKHIEVTGQESHEVNLHSERPETVPVSGRVVLRDRPQKGVAGAKVLGVATDDFALGRNLNSVSDSEGEFQSERGPFNMLVHAATPDGKLGGIVKMSADDEQVSIPIAPTGRAHGRLIQEETGAPVADRQIDYGVRIEFKSGSSSSRFGGHAVTNADGKFVIEKLVTGQEYELNAVLETDSEGRPRSWRTIAKVTAPNAEPVSLGDLNLKAPYKPPTLEERLAKVFNDSRTLEDRLQERLRDARLGYQRALMIIGDPQNPFVKQFYELEHDQSLSQEIYNYLFVPVSTVDAERKEETQKLLTRLGITWPVENEVLLTVLDEQGAVIASQPLHELTGDGGIDRSKLAAYLRGHSPALPDADTKLADALAQAKQDGKRVLVQVSGPRCGWCFVLSRYLDDHRDLIAKEFAYVKLDSRLTNGEQVIERVRPAAQGGIPWMVILDENGDAIITSDGPNGNIGYPGEPDGQVHFEKMLRADVNKLTDDEIKTLIGALAKANE